HTPLRAQVFETCMSADSITQPISNMYYSLCFRRALMTRHYRNYEDEDIIKAVKASFSIAQVLKHLGLSPTGANYVAMHAHFSRLSLDTGHFTGQGHLRGKTHNWTPERPLTEILVQHSDYHCSSSLKKRLIRAGLLVNCCSKCGL